MSRIKGLRFVFAAAILQLQACDAAVLRNMEATTMQATTEPQTQTQVSSLADSTIHQDLLGQTTLPPISNHTSTDIATDSDKTEVPIENQTVSNVQPQLSRNLLSRSELQLGGQSSLADTSEMDRDPTLVSTTELVSVGKSVPEVGKPTLDTVVMIPSQRVYSAKAETGIVSIPKVHFRKIESALTPKVREETSTLHLIPENLPTSPDNIVEHQKTNFSSYILTSVQVMAHAIDGLWKELKNNEEESYKVSENVSDTKQEGWEDDDSSKPVFQSNVPIVNEESVPMRVHMDIIPQGFPEDLEVPKFYPDYFDGTTDAMNSLVKKSSDSWEMDTVLRDIPIGQDSVEKNEDSFLKVQQLMRRNRYSDIFENLVDLHKNLTAYAGNHDIKMFKEISDREMDVLLRNAHNAAEQLKNIIPIISEEIDEKQLKDSFKTFIVNVSEPNSELLMVLSSLSPMRFL